MVPPDAFRRRVIRHKQDLKLSQDSVSYARLLIGKEIDIGPGQCRRIVLSMRSAEKPLRDFYTLLETPESLPLPARSLRHPLLLILDSACKLLHDLIQDISSLHVVCGSLSYHEANQHRQQILKQLEAFDQKKDDIVQGIDRWLLGANAIR